MQTITGFIIYFIIPKFEAIFRISDAAAQYHDLVIDASHFIIRYGPLRCSSRWSSSSFCSALPFSFLSWGNLHVPLFDRLLGRRHTALDPALAVAGGRGGQADLAGSLDPGQPLSDLVDPAAADEVESDVRQGSTGSRLCGGTD